MTRPFSLLIKPASADCNLRCAYCYYSSPDRGRRMSEDVLDRLIASYMATDQPRYVFIWQGGEPALAGLDFFRRVVELQQRYGRPGARVANALQTNGTLIAGQECPAHQSGIAGQECPAHQSGIAGQECPAYRSGIAGQECPAYRDDEFARVPGLWQPEKPVERGVQPV